MVFFIPNSNSNFKSYSLDIALFVLFVANFSPAHSYESRVALIAPAGEKFSTNSTNKTPEGESRVAGHCSKRLSKSASVWREHSP